MNRSPEDIFAELFMEKKAEVPPPAPEPVPEKAATPKPLTSRSVFSHPDAHPVALDLILLKNFEVDWLRWLPDTLFHEIEQTFGTSIAEINKVKILAAQTLHVTDAHWEEWEVFENVICALNGMIPRTDTIHPPDLPMLFAGVDIANDIRKETYGDEVARYCAAVFLHEHVHYAPEPLTFCQEYISDPMYHCQDCGKRGSAHAPFANLCPSCTHMFDSTHPFSFKPDPDMVKKGRGRNLKIENTFESEPTKRRFDELMAMDPTKVGAAIQERAEDIQAAKLITAVDFMKYRQQQLASQLNSLKGWLETA